MNKSPGKLVVNTYNIFPWCRLDYPGLRRQCVGPLLWQIDPNYGILWQPVCHICVGSVPIAVLVITHFLWHFLFWFAVFLIAPYLAVTQEHVDVPTFCFLYLCIFDILLLQISTSASFPRPVWSYVSVQRSTVLPKRAGLRSKGVSLVLLSNACLQCVTLITE